MPKVSEAHRARRRDQIVQAALEVMARRGVRGASMTDIIDASGLSAGAIYLHFASKQEILLAVTRRALEARLGLLDSREPAPGAPFTDLVAELVGVDDAVVATTVPLQLWSEATVDPEVREVVSRVLGLFRDGCERQLRLFAVAERGMGERQARRWAAQMAPVVVGLAQGAILQLAIRDDFDVAGYLAAAEPLFADG